MGHSCDSSNQKSNPDVETSTNCPRTETESRTLSEEDNGNHILGPLGCAFLWIFLTTVPLLLLSVKVLYLRSYGRPFQSGGIIFHDNATLHSAYWIYEWLWHYDQYAMNHLTYSLIS